MPELAVTIPNVPQEDRDQRSRLQYELGEPTYSEPAGVDRALCSVAQFVLALCAHRCAVDFSDCRCHRFHRRRDRTALRGHHELRQIDGSAGGQNHGGGGVHFTRAPQSSASMGSNNGRCAGLFDHRSAANGEREGPNSAGRKPRQTKNVVANRYHHFLSCPPVDCGTPVCESDPHLVAAGVGRSRSGVGLDYGCPDYLFGVRLCVAKSRVASAGSVAWLLARDLAIPPKAGAVLKLLT